MSLMNTKKDSKPASLQSHIRIELTNRTTSSLFTVYSVPSNIYTRVPESIQNDSLQKTVYSSVGELVSTGNPVASLQRGIPASTRVEK